MISLCILLVNMVGISGALDIFSGSMLSQYMALSVRLFCFVLLFCPKKIFKPLLSMVRRLRFSMFTVLTNIISSKALW